MSQLLTALAVRELALDCLLAPDQVQVLVEVQSVRTRFGFARDRLDHNRARIQELLAQLPPEFRAMGSGPAARGGWTFLNACVRADGVHWGEHPDVELLLALGLAIGSVRWLLERELWDVLPGGMPYFYIILPQVLASK